jgi:ATP-dependent Clp protease ATP-binding subunit ClpC
VGHDEGGQLTEIVRRKPYSVILFDEIEKAHPDVFNILLQILEDGRLTDAQGRTVDFRNAILIMTSNIGAEMITKDTPLGFGQTAVQGMTYDDMKGRITGELKRVFKPEFLNRVDEVIVFHKLERSEIGAIVDLMIARLQQQLDPSGVTLQLTDAGREVLVEKGFDPMLGARPLRRAIQRYIEDKLSDAMLERQFVEGTIILVDGEDEDTVLSVNGEVVGGRVELPMVGLDEPVAQGVGPVSSPSPGSDGPDAGGAAAGA